MRKEVAATEEMPNGVTRITYRIIIQNRGGVAAEDIVIEERVPTWTTHADIGLGWDCVLGPTGFDEAFFVDVCTLTIPFLAAQSETDTFFAVDVPDDIPNTALLNDVSALASNGEANPEDNETQVLTQVSERIPQQRDWRGAAAAWPRPPRRAS